MERGYVRQEPKKRGEEARERSHRGGGESATTKPTLAGHGRLSKESTICQKCYKNLGEEAVVLSMMSLVPA